MVGNNGNVSCGCGEQTPFIHTHVSGFPEAREASEASSPTLHSALPLQVPDLCPHPWSLTSLPQLG